MLEVSPYISFKGNCRDAIEFYKSAVDAEVLFTQTVGESPMSDMGPADNIMHCAMKAGNSTIMMLRRASLALPAIQKLLDVLQTASLRPKLELLAGYDTARTCAVIA